MVLGIEQVEQGVKEKGQEMEGRQECGQMLRAMAEVVFEMIALIFEGIVVFILDFPARTARLDDRGYGFSGQRELGHKRVVIELGARGIGERQLTPIDIEGIRAGA